MWKSRTFSRRESVKMAAKREAITVVGVNQHVVVTEEERVEAI